MNSERLITLSNLEEKTNNHLEKKTYSKVGTSGTVVFVLFAGAIALRTLGDENTPAYDFTRPSYIQYINLNQEKGYAGLYTNKTIDLLKIENLNKIKKMALFDEDWNGTGGSVFSEQAINLFTAIIEMLEKQPGIAPTGRNSLLMQYELEDKSLLVFEVGEDKTEKVYIPKGDYSLAEMEVFTENVGCRIKECVKDFYGFK